MKRDYNVCVIAIIIIFIFRMRNSESHKILRKNKNDGSINCNRKELHGILIVLCDDVMIYAFFLLTFMSEDISQWELNNII